MNKAFTDKMASVKDKAKGGQANAAILELCEVVEGMVLTPKAPKGPKAAKKTAKKK